MINTSNGWNYFFHIRCFSVNTENGPQILAKRGSNEVSSPVHRAQQLIPTPTIVTAPLSLEHRTLEYLNILFVGKKIAAVEFFQGLHCLQNTKIKIYRAMSNLLNKPALRFGDALASSRYCHVKFINL